MWLRTQDLFGLRKRPDSFPTSTSCAFSILLWGFMIVMPLLDRFTAVAGVTHGMFAPAVPLAVSAHENPSAGPAGIAPGLLARAARSLAIG
jgi:hypothetical protein